MRRTLFSPIFRHYGQNNRDESNNKLMYSVLEKVLVYRVRHPISDPHTIADRLSISRLIHDLGWMSVMVSARDAKSVFGKAFSRPPRLLFLNPVCLLFALYYAYVYGTYAVHLKSPHPIVLS